MKPKIGQIYVDGYNKGRYVRVTGAPVAPGFDWRVVRCNSDGSDMPRAYTGFMAECAVGRRYMPAKQARPK